MNNTEKIKRLLEIGEILDTPGGKFVVDFNKCAKFPEFQETLKRISELKIEERVS